MTDSVSKLKRRILDLEQQMEENSERNASIIEFSPTGIYIIDDKFKLVYVNKRLSEILGYTIDELLSLDFTHFLDEDSRELVIENYKRRQRNESIPSQYEFNIIRKNGQKRRVRINATISQNTDGKVFSIGHILDITDTWQSSRLQSAIFRISEAASKSKNLASLFASIHMIMGSILDVTNFYIALHDKDRDILDFPYYIDEIDEQPEPQKFGHGLTEYIIRSGEPLFINEQGIYDLAKERKIELLGTPSKLWMGSPLRIENRIIGVVVVQSYQNENLYSQSDLHILNYVSEQIATSIRNKMAEEALLIEKTHLEELFQNSPEAIALVNEMSNIQRINNEFTNLFGYTAEEAVGQNIDEIITDTWQKEEAQSITRRVASGEHIRLEMVRIRQDGSPVYVSVLGAPVLNPGGKQSVYAIYRDITERKLWEEKIRSSEGKYRRLSNRLTEINNMKDLLLDVITHDLKNPAGVISGMTEILMNETADSDSIAIISEASENLLKVIENATTLSKITIGDAIQKENIELTQMLTDISQEYSSQLHNAGIYLEKKLDDNMTVEANPIIAEVFRNYIDNAIKYASDGKKIIITSHCDPTSVTIKVSDNGTTIPLENRRSIFKRNIQLDRKDKKGHGLGLAIVERIAVVHNAAVWVEPNIPQGNSFCFKIPRS